VGGIATAPQRVVMAAGGPGLDSVDEVVVGSNHTCALAKGQIFCWGYQNLGALGNGVDALSSSPYPVKVGVPATNVPSHIAGLHNSTCMATTKNNAAGAVYCWGDNQYGQLGDGTKTSRKVPTLVTSVAAATDIGMGLSHSCAITPVNGNLLCWGNNLAGQLGNNTNMESLSAVQVLIAGPSPLKPLTGVSSMSGGGFLNSPTTSFSCAVASGKVYCWGHGGYGNLGQNSTASSFAAVNVNFIPSAVDLHTSQGAACVRSATGAAAPLYCWGNNANGQFGTGSSSAQVLSPVSSAMGQTIPRHSMGDNHACALSTTPSPHVICAGNNGSGQLGDGTKITSSSFVSVVFP
jgi:alpha-tubulin suppressor-like RCC1 family protein